MTFEDFCDSLSESQAPASLSIPLKALWSDRNADWDEAHQLVQDESTKDAAWVHAYLHRKEGDLSNAGYWYSRAGKSQSNASLDDEWEEIVETLLNRS